MAMGKLALSAFPPEVHTGKITEEKMQTVRDSWVRYLERRFPGKSTANLVKYNFKQVEGEEDTSKLSDEVHG